MSRFKTLPLSWLCDLLYLLSSPLLVPAWLFLSRLMTREKYRRGFFRKLGSVERREGASRSLWVLTVAPLIEARERGLEDWDVSLSVSTPTGFDTARKRLPGTTVFYAPFDLSPCVARTFSRRRPDALLLLELEVWPNFLLAARRRGLPVMVANGRLSGGSSERYLRTGFLGRWLFSMVDRVAAQNEVYAGRFETLGVDPGNIEVLGNLKHDREVSVTAADAAELRRRLGWSSGELVIVGGCTHPGEESILLGILSGLESSHPGLRLVLAPRHIERLAGEKPSGWPGRGAAERSFTRWSEWREGAGEPLGDSILVVDTVGELERFYSIADLAVVGGSFVPHGGHNVLEPASLSKAVLFGPHTENFEDEVALLLEAQAAGVPVVASQAGGIPEAVEDNVTGMLVRARDPAAIAGAVIELLAHPDQRARMGEAGRRHVAQYFSVDAMLSGNLSVYNSILQALTDDQQ